MENPQPVRSDWFGSLLRIVLGVYLFFYLLEHFASGGWPLGWRVRRGQEKEMIQRVEAAGGWPALQKACEALVASNKDTGFQWMRGYGPGPLPIAIQKLKPQEVYFQSPTLTRGTDFASDFLVVRIKVFGGHRTGSYAIPYFGLEFVSGTNADRYVPSPSHGGASGNSYNSYSKVSDRIYEIYGPR